MRLTDPPLAEDDTTLPPVPVSIRSRILRYPTGDAAALHDSVGPATSSAVAATAPTPSSSAPTTAPSSNAEPATTLPLDTGGASRSGPGHRDSAGGEAPSTDLSRTQQPFPPPAAKKKKSKEASEKTPLYTIVLDPRLGVSSCFSQQVLDDHVINAANPLQHSEMTDDYCQLQLGSFAGDSLEVYYSASQPPGRVTRLSIHDLLASDAARITGEEDYPVSLDLSAFRCVDIYEFDDCETVDSHVIQTNWTSPDPDWAVLPEDSKSNSDLDPFSTEDEQGGADIPYRAVSDDGADSVNGSDRVNMENDEEELPTLEELRSTDYLSRCHPIAALEAFPAAIQAKLIFQDENDFMIEYVRARTTQRVLQDYTVLIDGKAWHWHSVRPGEVGLEEHLNTSSGDMVFLQPSDRGVDLQCQRLQSTIRRVIDDLHHAMRHLETNDALLGIPADDGLISRSSRHALARDAIICAMDSPPTIHLHRRVFALDSKPYDEGTTLFLRLPLDPGTSAFHHLPPDALIPRISNEAMTRWTSSHLTGASDDDMARWQLMALAHTTFCVTALVDIMAPFPLMSRSFALREQIDLNALDTTGAGYLFELRPGLGRMHQLASSPHPIQGTICTLTALAIPLRRAGNVAYAARIPDKTARTLVADSGAANPASYSGVIGAVQATGAGAGSGPVHTPSSGSAYSVGSGHNAPLLLPIPDARALAERITQGHRDSAAWQLRADKEVERTRQTAASTSEALAAVVGDLRTVNATAAATATILQQLLTQTKEMRAETTTRANLMEDRLKIMQVQTTAAIESSENTLHARLTPLVSQLLDSGMAPMVSELREANRGLSESLATLTTRMDNLTAMRSTVLTYLADAVRHEIEQFDHNADWPAFALNFIQSCGPVNIRDGFHALKLLVQGADKDDQRGNDNNGYRGNDNRGDHNDRPGGEQRRGYSSGQDDPRVSGEANTRGGDGFPAPLASAIRPTKTRFDGKINHIETETPLDVRDLADDPSQFSDHGSPTFEDATSEPDDREASSPGNGD
ncbi:hypothetical protein T484DRAFT_1859553 [Baffinella frigidus]|nr:hypothetical protein T484DRAFT_1859553 [Cryptophyta sp. CCMP2293]